MSSITNLFKYKESNRTEFVVYISQILDIAIEQYEDIVVEVEERTINTNADVEFIFGENHLEEKQQIWTALSVTIDGIFERYLNKYSQDKDYIKLHEVYKTLEVEYKNLFDEHL